MTLHQLQTSNGKFSIAAFDQRSSLVKLLGVDPLSKSGKEVMIRMKNLFMEVFSPICSGVLTDPEFGLPSIEKKSEMAGLLLSLERSAYEQESPESMPEFYPHWGVQEIVDHDGAVKLLLNYHPRAYNAEQKREHISELYGQAQARKTAFLLEPIVYVPKNTVTNMSGYEAQLQTVKDFTERCDVLKIEFPVPSQEELNVNIAARRCEEITWATRKPWIVLSRGMSFERFLLALDIAMKNGAKGFAVGRAVWKEVGEFSTWEEQEKFIRTVAKERMLKLIEVVRRY